MRRLLISALCFAVSSAVSFCLMHAVSSAPVSAAAADTVTLSSDWFQNHLPSFTAQYYSFDGTYKPIDFQYRSRQSWTSDTSHIDTPSNFTSGRSFTAYWAATPQDMYNSATGPFIQFDLNLSFSHVTYIDCGLAAWVGNPAGHQYGSDKYAKTPVSEVRPNFYTMYAFGASAIQYLQNNPLADCGGYVNVSGDSAIYGGWFNVFTSSSPKKFNFGEQHICCFASTNGIWIALPDIFINSDYTYDGIVSPEVPSYGQGTASGTASGTISIDSDTGVQNVDLDVNVDVPLPDLSGLESAVGDVAEGILGGNDPAPPELIAEPPEDIDFDTALEDADAILDDVPDVTAASGFWFALWNKFFVDQDGNTNPMIIMVVLFPVAILLNLVSQILWKR